MFAETLRKVVDNVDGALAAVIMGLDGIPVDSYVRNDRVDVTTVGMEFSFIIGQIKKAGDSLQVGGLEELSVKAQRLVLVSRMVSPQYFVAIAMAPEAKRAAPAASKHPRNPSLAAKRGRVLIGIEISQILLLGSTGAPTVLVLLQKAQ